MLGIFEEIVVKITRYNGLENEPKQIKTIRIDINGVEYKLKEVDNGLMITVSGDYHTSIQPYSINAFNITCTERG